MNYNNIFGFIWVYLGLFGIYIIYLRAENSNVCPHPCRGFRGFTLL